MSDVGVFVIIIIVEIAIVIICGIFCLPCIGKCFIRIFGKKLKHPTTQASTLAMQNLTNNRNQTAILSPNDLVLRNSEVILNPRPKRTNTLNPSDSRDASVMNPLICPEHASTPPIAFQSNHLPIPPSAPIQGHNNFIYATSQTFIPPSSHDEPPDYSSVVSAQYLATQNGPYVIRTMI